MPAFNDSTVSHDITNVFLKENEGFKIIDEASATVTYIGFIKQTYDNAEPPNPKLVGNTAHAIWRIVRITVAGTITTREFPNGINDYQFVWNDRLTLSYQ